MSETEILEWLREAKENPQYSNVSFDEIYITNDMLATLVEVFSGLSKRHQAYWDRINLEFCSGRNVDMIASTALLMDCVKHLFVASDEGGEETEGLVVRVAAALRVNLSLKSLWLLLPLTLESVVALGEALAVNNALDKFNLSGSRWINEDVFLDDGNETDTYATDTDDEYYKDSSRYYTSSDDDDEGVVAANVRILRYTDPQLVEQALRSAKALAEGLRYNTSLRTIDLSSCELPDAALGVIIQSLVGHPSLETLDVSRNRAGPDTVQALAELVGHPESALTTLDLREQRKKSSKRRNKPKSKATRRRGGRSGENDDNDEEDEDEDDFDAAARNGLDLTALSQALYNNEVIQVLRLSHNQLTDDQIAELVRNLQGNDSLQEIDLQFNSITTRGVKAITKGLSELPALKVLLLGGNDFGKEGNKMLAQLEDDDDSVCTIMETGRGGKDEDDEETFHSAKSSNTRHKSPTKSSNRKPAVGGFMGGLTGISER